MRGPFTSALIVSALFGTCSVLALPVTPEPPVAEPEKVPELPGRPAYMFPILDGLAQPHLQINQTVEVAHIVEAANISKSESPRQPDVNLHHHRERQSWSTEESNSGSGSFETRHFSTSSTEEPLPTDRRRSPRSASEDGTTEAPEGDEGTTDGTTDEDEATTDATTDEDEATTDATTDEDEATTDATTDDEEDVTTDAMTDEDDVKTDATTDEDEATTEATSDTTDDGETTTDAVTSSDEATTDATTSDDDDETTDDAEATTVAATAEDEEATTEPAAADEETDAPETLNRRRRNFNLTEIPTDRRRSDSEESATEEPIVFRPCFPEDEDPECGRPMPIKTLNVVIIDKIGSFPPLSTEEANITGAPESKPIEQPAEVERLGNTTTQQPTTTTTGPWWFFWPFN
ncbi:unnamed protein product, partial [Mesorhabditis spiculigera]